MSVWRRDPRARYRRAALSLAVVLAGLGAAGCNSTNAQTASTTVIPPPPGCDTGRVLVVGASLDLSGHGAAIGREELSGLELGIDKVNAAGGVWPRNSCLELLYKDNRGSPAIDAQAMLDLVNAEKAAVVVGDFLGASTRSYLGSLGVPAISLSHLQATFTPRAYPNTFPVTASMRSQASVMARTLKKDGIRTVGMIVTADEASRQGADRLAALAAPDGFAIVARAEVAPSGRGVGAALQRVRARHPQALVVMDDAGAVASVLAARVAQGWTAPVLAGADATTAPILDRAGGTRVADGVSVVVPAGAVKTSGPASVPTLRFRASLLAQLRTSTLRGSIIPYAEAYDAVAMIGSVINGAKASSATDVTSFLQNTDYQGVLAVYAYSPASHSGIGVTGQAVVPLSGLSDGLLAPARSTGAPSPTTSAPSP